MVQTARPVADVEIDSWTNNLGESANLFQSIDEVTPHDASFVISPTDPQGDPFVVRLGAVEDPIGSIDHVFRFRYQKSDAGGARVDMVAQIREGYVDEANQGTLIAEGVFPNIPNGWNTGEVVLTTGEADSITDYADLYARFVMTQV